MTISFTIPGLPRTKKNHGFRTKQGLAMPSEAFARWNKMAQVYLMVWRMKQPAEREILGPVNCRALFFRDTLTGDAVGYYQALADALEEAGIVENDALIVQWDGSRLLKDAKNPRIEVELTTL